MSTADFNTPRRRNPAPPLLSILTLSFCAFALTTAEFVIAGILPEVAADLSVSISSAGQLVTAYALGMVVGGPLLTLCTAGVGRRPLILALLAAFVAGNLVAAVAPGYQVLLIGRVLSGFVVATFFAMAIVIAASLAPPDRQASAVAKVALGFNLAMILGAPIGTAIGQQFGWRSTFLAIAALAAIALGLLARFVPVPEAAATSSPMAELRALRSRGLQLALALTAIGNAGVLMVFTYLAPLLTEVHGFGGGAIPWLLLLYGLGASAGNLAGGWLADRALLSSLIGLLGALAGALCVLFRLVEGSRPAVMVMVFVVGALAASIIPAMQTRVLVMARQAPTFGIALNASGFQLAAAFAAWLGGIVIDSDAGLRWIYPVAAVLTVVGASVAFVSWLHLRRTAEVSA